MSRVKDDLISELIRVSQTNLLNKKKATCNKGSENDVILDWIKSNAARYRHGSMEFLDFYSPTVLGRMLSELTETNKDLSEIIENYPQDKPVPDILNKTLI